MPQIDIYTSPLCGYCHMAKGLLKAKGADFTEIDIWAEPARKPEMIERAGGRRTVPQIFIGGVHVGGSDELHALEREGRLDAMLAGGGQGG